MHSLHGMKNKKFREKLTKLLQTAFLWMVKIIQGLSTAIPT